MKKITLLLAFSLFFQILASAQSSLLQQNYLEESTSTSLQTTVYEIQYTDNPNGTSEYLNQQVDVTAVVTASTQIFDLGYVYIQDEGGGPWTGIWLRGAGLEQFYRKEEVALTGTVMEEFGMTYILVSQIDKTGQLREIVTTEIDPADTATYAANGWEQWEGCLVSYRDAEGDSLYFSHPNMGFGDYGVSALGSSGPVTRGRILAGRQSSSSHSSLWVQLVADEAYQDLDGQMNVDPIETSPEIKMQCVTGLMAYSFGDYRLLPRNNDDFCGINIDMDTTNLPNSPLTSIREINSVQLNVYPNPATSRINIQLDPNQIAEVRVVNQFGQHLLSSQNSTLDVSFLDAGYYFLITRLKDGKVATNTFSVVKQ